MKKFLSLSMLVAAMAFTVPSAQASTNSVNEMAAESYGAVQTYRVRRNGRVVREYTRYRNVRVGRRVYRETYRITVLPNGRTRTRLISRTRIR